MSGEFLLRRSVHSVIVLFGTITLVFFLVRLVPADPVRIMTGFNASPEDVQATRKALGLDHPIYVQYVIFLRSLAGGDLGQSLSYHRPVVRLVLERLPATVLLAASSMLFATIVGLPAGILAAVRRDTVYDRITVAGSLFGQSVPTFWLGIVLILIFAVMLHALPTSGYGGWRHIVLPMMTLGLYMVALITRMSRSSMLEVLGSDYLRTARSKGLQEGAVLIRHALRNALIPVVTVIGLQTGTLLGGAVITETVFAWPGIGLLTVDSITSLDYSVVQAVVILSAGIFVLMNVFLDMLYVALDPRIKYG